MSRNSGYSMRRALPLVFALLLASPAFAGWDEGAAAYQRKDWSAALTELEPLAKSGHAGAASRLGQMYLNGWGVPRNEAEAFRLTSMAAEKGDLASQNNLGGMYYRGTGTTRDTGKALVWYARAADQGQPNAINNLGQLYFLGGGITKDEAKGVSYLRQAADKDIPASWETLGLAYWDGRGVAADRVEAVRWFRKAAERGLMVSQNRLGAALWMGDGTAKNQGEAVQWFEKAALQGDASSLYNTANAYLSGTGVGRDQSKAALYLILAAQRAKPADKTRFDEARDKAKAAMTPDQWAIAEVKARNWNPQAANASGGTAEASAAPSTSAAPAPQSAAPARPQRSSGTGILVSRDGTILTNSHVVERCRNIRVSLEGQSPQAGVVAARDATNDFAALSTSLRTPDIARFREDKPMRSGDGVVVIGYPLSSMLSREPNVTAGVISALAGMKGDKRHYQITAPVQKGNSGGPLSDMSGNVVGIVTSKLNAMEVANRTGDLPQNVNFAIKSELARKFLGDNGLSFETAGAAANLSAADVGDLIKKVTVFIECEG